SFTNGQKLLVKESRQDVIRLVKEYEREIRAGL
ncbi:MAG: flagellar FlbD family protein, partial [Lachnospiraceae bacterium]|nr:flagellar FlbD family protein [Lachnospiraceae bacterium]